MADIALDVACKVAEYLVAPIGRHCGYVIFCDSHVCQLKLEGLKLGHKMFDVQKSIDDARNNVKPIKPEVENWLEKAKDVAKMAIDVLKYDGRAEKTCCYGRLPNPKGRYCLGRDVMQTVQAIQALNPEGKFKEVCHERDPPGRVARPHDVNSPAGDGGDIIQELIALCQSKKFDSKNPPPGLSGSAPKENSLAADRGDTITDSRASIFQDIMNALDDEKHKVIGVYGPGGVGKTTLLEEVEKKLRNEGRPFRIIAKAKVSETPDLKTIQDDIAYASGLHLKDEPSEAGRRDLLLKRLQKDPREKEKDPNEKILIILDDLWKKLELRDVGIPLGDESSNCKLLLTSRYRDVLQQMKCASPIFHLEGLKDNEALRLFEREVGDRLKDEEDLKAIAPQVVKKLAGLPLLIISVARALKDSDVAAWRNALIKIDAEENETIVQLSYNHLKSEEARSLFLLCGLLGGTIQVETLLVLGMGLGLFEEYKKTIQDSRDRLDTMLSELRSACLLLEGGDNKENVTIHDLYSEVVLSAPFRNENSLMINSNYGTWPKETLEKCWACLVNVGSDRLAELIMLGRFSHAKILMLSEQHDMGDCSRMDFTYMKELRALCLRSMSITSLPSSMEILKNLQSLSINCHVEDVAIIGNLKALQILSFAGSAISRLPKQIGDLTNLRSLNLSDCSTLKIIEPGVLKGLINLEELHTKGSSIRWLGKDEISSESCNARLAELKSLTKLASLEISISNPTILLEDGDLPFENLIRFWINIGNVGGREFKGLRTMKLKLEGCGRILSKEWVQKTLHKTQYLHLIGLSEFKKSAHELCTQGFQELKHLDIDDSSSIKYIANSSGGLPLTAFTKLESLFLESLDNLEKICHDPIAPECFSKLKAVSVKYCNQLKYLWCLSEIQKLVQLEEIEVWGCDSMRAIITDDGGEDIVAADHKVELPNVRRLELYSLPNMTSFCTEAEITSEGTPIQVSLPRLESLVMHGFLGPEKILYSQPPFKYSHLKSIEIWLSKSTSSIMNSDWMLNMPNLESLVIRYCQSAEVVFDLEELEVTEHVEILPRLMYLTLRTSQNLQCMWKQDVKLQGILVFRNLKKLVVQNLGLAFLFPIFVAKCLREISDIQVENCPNMKAVIMDEEGRDEGTDDTIELPLLERLYIKDCPTMEKFFLCPRGKKESVTTTSNSQDTYSDSFFDRKVSLPSLEELSFEHVGSLKRIWHGELLRSSFCKLTTLNLYDCSGLLNVFPSAITERLHNLERVKVFLCPSLESLFDFGSLESSTKQIEVLLPRLVSIDVETCRSLESLFHCGSLDSNTGQTIVLLPKLEDLSVAGVGRLRHVVKSDSQAVLGFPNLKNVNVYDCSELRYLFPNSTAATLKKLETLSINICKQMKEVVPEEEGGRSKAYVTSFPSLTNLTLMSLDNLICFSSGSCSYDFASLEELSIARCPNFGAFIPSPTSVKRPLGETAEEDDESPQPLFNEMVTFPNLRKLNIEDVQCKELWSNQIPTDSFCKLESLELCFCDNLLHIAPSHMWKTLQRCLEILEVTFCHSVEIIYECDETVTKSSKLRGLVLCGLDNLRHIWQYDGLPNASFPNLSSIRVSSCPRLEILFPTFTAEFLGQIEKLEVWNCENMQRIAGHGECEEATGTTITFSKLTELNLVNLSKFRSYLPEKYSTEFPTIMKKRWVQSCGTEYL